MLATCYRAQCIRTAEGFAARAGLRRDQWSVSFQSRLGRAKWIEPYTETRLDELAEQGVKKLLVMCPAFVSDCIETLEEIGDRGREQFIEAGGGAGVGAVPEYPRGLGAGAGPALQPSAAGAPPAVMSPRATPRPSWAAVGDAVRCG